jgi:hypothetical protein
MSAPIAVAIDGLMDCDMCSGERYVWAYPACGERMEHFQVVDFPLDEACVCGAVSRITAGEDKRWEREVLGR